MITDRVVQSMSAEDERRLDDQLCEMVLEGVVAELEVIPATALLDSAVVTVNSAMVNCHIRDSAIKIVEAEHRYILHAGSVMEMVFPISVSGLWGMYFAKFDPVSVTTEYYGRWAVNPLSRYYDVIAGYRREGLADSQIAKRIRDAWADKGVVASAEGTRMHRNIELVLGGNWYGRRGVEMVSRRQVEMNGMYEQR